MRSSNGRERIVALQARLDEGIALATPRLGHFEPLVREGSWVNAEGVIGVLTTLGQRVDVVVPQDIVAACVTTLSVKRGAVGYGDALLRLRVGGAPLREELTGEDCDESLQHSGGFVFNAPQPGRIYLRPSPEDPPYVERGDVIARGAVVALVEIMKTFTPLRLEGVSLPARLRCVETLVEDGQEIAIGDALLRLEEVKQ